MKRKMFNKVMAASLTATMTMSLAGCGGNAATTEAPADTTGEISRQQLLKLRQQNQKLQ